MSREGNQPVVTTVLLDRWENALKLALTIRVRLWNGMGVIMSSSKDRSNPRRGRTWHRPHLLIALLAIVAIAGVGMALEPANAKRRDTYGTKSDVAFAKRLWTALTDNRLVGENRINAMPIEGKAPHAKIQQVLAGDIRVRGRTGRAIVKVNYREAGATVASVYEAPQKYLSDYAVMFQREKGYAPGENDWFWALYTADGRLKIYEGRQIAGQVGRETKEGCIGCHVAKGGRDLEALTRH